MGYSTLAALAADTVDHLVMLLSIEDVQNDVGEPPNSLAVGELS